MQIAKNKKGNILYLFLGAMLIMGVIAGIMTFGSLKNGEGLAITRLMGASTEIEMNVINPYAEEGQPITVSYEVLNFGQERSLCGFIELWADSTLADSRYFCMSNTNKYGRDAHVLENNVTIAGLDEGSHALVLRYSTAEGSFDVDDEYLRNYRSCPDGDKYTLLVGNPEREKTIYYEPDVNNAFREFLPVMPCDIKTEFPGYNDEFTYNASLIDYARSIDSSFDFKQQAKVVYIAKSGAFDKAVEEDNAGTVQTTTDDETWWTTIKSWFV